MIPEIVSGVNYRSTGRSYGHRTVEGHHLANRTVLRRLMKVRPTLICATYRTPLQGVYGQCSSVQTSLFPSFTLPPPISLCGKVNYNTLFKIINYIDLLINYSDRPLWLCIMEHKTIINIKISFRYKSNDYDKQQSNIKTVHKIPRLFSARVFSSRA